MSDRFEIYSGFNIRAFESSPGKWTAEIRKVDGSQIQILLPELGEDVLECLTTDPETMTAEAAYRTCVGGYRRRMPTGSSKLSDSKMSSRYHLQVKRDLRRRLRF